MLLLSSSAVILQCLASTWDPCPGWSLHFFMLKSWRLNIPSFKCWHALTPVSGITCASPGAPGWSHLRSWIPLPSAVRQRHQVCLKQTFTENMLLRLLLKKQANRVISMMPCNLGVEGEPWASEWKVETQGQTTVPSRLWRALENHCLQLALLQKAEEKGDLPLCKRLTRC